MKTLQQLKQQILYNDEIEQYKKQVLELYTELEPKIIQGIKDRVNNIKLCEVSKDYAEIIKQKFNEFGYNIELVYHNDSLEITSVILHFNTIYTDKLKVETSKVQSLSTLIENNINTADLCEYITPPPKRPVAPKSIVIRENFFGNI